MFIKQYKETFLGNIMVTLFIDSWENFEVLDFIENKLISEGKEKTPNST